jgi:hypothetical protein
MLLDLLRLLHPPSLPVEHSEAARVRAALDWLALAWVSHHSIS